MTAALGRSRVFGLLARALRYPDEALFGALRDGRWAGSLVKAASQSGLEHDAVFFCDVERVAETLPNAVAELQALHTALFSSGSACPHQESDYVARHAFQKADVMADVAGFYAAFGLRVSRDNRQLPDFLGSELEFLHTVSWKEAQADREGNHAAAAICRQAVEKFLDQHLGAWVAPFRERMEQTSVGGFYATLARMVEDFVRGYATGSGAGRQ